jgi:serine/threonine protein kinase
MDSICFDDFDSKYEIIKLIGMGGSSSVFQILNVKDDEFYCLKRIDYFYTEGVKYPLEKVLDEIRILEYISSYNHPYIIKFLDVFRDDDFYYIITEYVPGLSITDIIYDIDDPEDDDDPNEFEIVKYIRDVKDRLNIGILSMTELLKFIFLPLYEVIIFLKNHNISHGDILGDNIVIYKHDDGTIKFKLIDFGMSRGLKSEYKTNASHANDLYELGYIMNKIFSHDYRQFIDLLLSCKNDNKEHFEEIQNSYMKLV